MKLDALVKELQEYLSLLNAKQIGDFDGDTLSRLIVKLASYNSTLGQYVAMAERDAAMADAEYDLERERIFAEAREAGKTIGDADNLKRTGAADKQKEVIKLKYNHRVMQLLRNDVSTLIDTVRSRLSWLKSEHDEGV